MRTRLPGLVAILAACSCACSPTEQVPRSGRGVLVIVVDGLRADHLDAYGYGRETAPTLNQLAREGLLLTEAFTASPRRLPAHAALLTGCDPLPVQRLIPEGVEESLLEDLAWGWSIPERYPSLAVELLSRGWETAGFFDHENLTPVRGFQRGFGHFETTVGEDAPRSLDEAGARVLGERFGRWLRGLDDDADWFAYVELSDLERSWRLPDPQWERYFAPETSGSAVPPVGNTDEVFHAIPRSRWRGVSLSVSEYVAQYDGHVRRLDGELRRLLGGLDQRGFDERTTVIVLGSYGVQFGEANRYLAGGSYSMADLHIPWILRPSAALSESVRPAGSRIDGLASGVDLAPTLLDLLDVPIPFAMHGQSLKPILGGIRSSVRTECFATLGLLGGWAAIGPRVVVERLQLDRGADAALVRAWSGTLEPGAPAYFAYDRVLDRFPSAEYVHSLPSDPETQRLARAATDWYERLGVVRDVLQRSWFRRPGSDDNEGQLEDEGWIVKSP